MSEETQKRIGELYRAGRFPNDAQAKAWADKYFPEKKEEEKEEPKKKGKK